MFSLCLLQGSREINATLGGVKFHGMGEFLNEPGTQEAECFVIQLGTVQNRQQSVWEHGPNPPPPPPPGICTIFKTVTGSKPTAATTISGPSLCM